MSLPNKAEVCGLSYACLTPKKAALLAKERIERGGFFSVFTPGATIHADALRNKARLALLSRADLLLPDGAGVLLASRLCRASIDERCAGITFAETLLSIAEGGTRFFFYGGREGVAARAAENMKKRYPHLLFCTASGYGEPPIKEITSFAPHALFVCLGYPKQEQFILSQKQRLSCLCVGLAGSLDVWAGEVSRAPQGWQRLGLEWAYRTLKEPRRLPKLFPLPAYFLAAWREGRKKHRKAGAKADRIG